LPSYTDFDLDLRTEAVDDCHKTVHREPCEVGIPDAREVGGGDARPGMSGAHGEAFLVERLDDFGGKEALASGRSPDRRSSRAASCRAA
jgi:hypothetical protein